MRLIEAIGAALVVGLIGGVICSRTGADPVLGFALGALAGFAAWGVRGKTSTRYGGKK
ncbi:hypothetical protein [Catenuloplanes atrovinosus]|uniref:Uncharacterized protein n=1 Tax=Catenuloplanes atrovinosus TaxID=137266 RepID=A0AAE3YV59_9ACTN|nr:hypothetical protein [Catenuloplanes atrovinosus]MDR7278958.1 hypothetical protein [Catenuloplanes atrovinosus]